MPPRLSRAQFARSDASEKGTVASRAFDRGTCEYRGVACVFFEAAQISRAELTEIFTDHQGHEGVHAIAHAPRRLVQVSATRHHVWKCARGT